MKQMKDSGIEWIGECPEHWEFVRGRYLFKQRNTKGNLKNLELLSPSQKFGVVPQTLLEELTTQTVVKVKEDTNLETFKTIHVGDFCISLRSFQGGFEYSKYEGVVSSAYQVFYPIVPIYDGYYKFLFKDKSFIEKMNSYTISFRDGKNIAFEDFGNTYIPYPPIDEQRKIAEFLDKKCEEVDGLIADIQTQIDTLEQYKRSTITEAVTKGNGIVPKFVDGEIQLSGAIPVGWAVVKLKAICEHKSEMNSGDRELLSVYLDRGVIRYSDSTNMQVHKPSESLDKYQNVDIGDFVMNNQQAWRGSVGVSKYRGIISPAYHIFSLSKACNPNYMNYLFRDNFMVQQYEFCSRGVGSIQRNIYVPWLKNCLVLLPPIDEQKSIAEYLDKKCAEIDACIEEKKSQISVLETYKKSIIFEYVTGKKEVV